MLCRVCNLPLGTCSVAFGGRAFTKPVTVRQCILANRRMRTAACLDAHITRSVHAIEVSVVRDRISRSVS